MQKAEPVLTVPAIDDSVLWMGRVRRGSTGIEMSFPGVTMLFRARAERIKLDMHATSDDCWCDVVVDGSDPCPLNIPKESGVLEVPEAMCSRGTHEVRVTVRTEAWQGVVAVRGIVLSGDAELLEPSELPKRKLLFIGDSITAGAGTDKLPPAYPEGGIGNNANRAFGMELGRRLNAQVHLVAYGGKGITRDWQGFGADEVVTAPLFFERSLPDDPVSHWDHSSYSPDAITVCLGTNDFNVGIPDEVHWTSAYHAFVTRIRQVHPRPWIFLATSPILATSDTLRARAKAAALEHYLDRIVGRCLEEGDERVEAISVRGQPGTEKDGHPIASQHLKIADDLEPVLRARLRW